MLSFKNWEEINPWLPNETFSIHSSKMAIRMTSEQTSLTNNHQSCYLLLSSLPKVLLSSQLQEAYLSNGFSCYTLLLHSFSMQKLLQPMAKQAGCWETGASSD